MIKDLQHDMSIPTSRDERARQEFVGTLRSHILGDMAVSMRQRYDERLAPAFTRSTGAAPTTGEAVHDLMLGDDYFRFYSAIRYNAQEMAFRSVIPTVERQLDDLVDRGRAARDAGANVFVDPEFTVPKNVANIDVHLAPGSYDTEYVDDDVAAGAIYDNSINVFAFNQMGRNVDDIGWTMANYLRLKHPSFEPKRILDCGCTVGHNTVPWKLTFPDARVTGIDVSAPVLRYAAARALSFGADVDFVQMDATSLDYPDASFDVVFSSMFLHELPLKHIRAYLAEAQRVLRPGGLMLNMELPPNSKLEAFDQFYLDWDSYYNNEPFYKTFRDQDARALCAEAGFDASDFIEFVAPRYTYVGEEQFKAEIANGEATFDSKTGTLTDDLRWYAFGCFKSQE